MKSVIEILVAWAIGTVVPLLIYMQMIFWLIIADCTFGVIMANREGNFSWRKFFDTFSKGIGLAFLMIAFNEVQRTLQIPIIKVADIELSASLFLAGLIAVHEVESIEKKTEVLYGFAFFKTIKSKFPSFDNFKIEKTENNDGTTDQPK